MWTESIYKLNPLSGSGSYIRRPLRRTYCGLLLLHYDSGCNTNLKGCYQRSLGKPTCLIGAWPQNLSLPDRGMPNMLRHTTDAGIHIFAYWRQATDAQHERSNAPAGSRILQFMRRLRNGKRQIETQSQALAAQVYAQVIYNKNWQLWQTADRAVSTLYRRSPRTQSFSVDGTSARKIGDACPRSLITA